MQSIRTSFQIITVLVLALALFVTIPPAHATGTTITVTGTADDATVASLNGNGTCDLREAIVAASSNSAQGECPAGSSTGTDIIHFDIGGGGAQTITLAAQVDVTGPVYIDGTSQGRYVDVPLIQITGSASSLLYFPSTGGSSTVKGLKLTNTNTGYPLYFYFSEYNTVVGNRISKSGSGSTLYFFYSGHNTVAGNYINSDGTASLGSNATGVSLFSSSYNTIGGSDDGDGNLFGGGSPISIANGFSNVIQGNTFGLQPDGSTALTGLQSLSGSNIAIQIGSAGASSANGNTIRDNVIGGYPYAIYLDGRSLTTGTISQTTIAGNKIGIGADGSTVRSNRIGIGLWGASNNTIGGPTDADRNVISGSLQRDIEIIDETRHPDGNQIQGNYIGTNASGTAAVSPTATYGIYVEGGNANVIGGTDAGSGNVISGNGYGIYVGPPSSGTVIRGNKIGTDKTGNAAISNQYAIFVQSSANIGDATTPGNNVISGNTPNPALTIGNATVTVFGNKIGVSAAGGPLGNNHGVRVAPAASVSLGSNWIANTATNAGITIEVGATVTSASQNCFTGNLKGVDNYNTTSAPFSNNWWNSASGPGGVGPGSGDAVSSYVNYSSWLTSAPDICAPVVSLDATSLSFGNQNIGTTSSAQTVTLTNDGGKVMTISSIAASTSYSLGAGSCPASGGTLNAGASCTILVQFSPTAAGLAPGTVTITTGANSGTDTITLAGTGTLPAVWLDLSSLSFDDQTVGTTSSPQIVALSNLGTGVLHITSITAPAQYSLGAGTCPVSGGTLAAGASCSILVQFSPTVAGSATGSVSIATDAASSPYTIDLTGIGIQPLVALDPSALEFAAQWVGTTSSAHTVKLTNNGNTFLTFSSITTSAPYSLGGGTCPTYSATLGAGASCTILVQFSPTAAGSAPGEVTIISDAPSSPDHITLTGSGTLGTQPAVSLDPATLTFSAQLVGTTSSPQTVALTNNGAAALTIGSMTTSAPYSLGAGNCPVSGGTVDPGASCTILVQFSPTGAGSAPATVTITSDAASSPDHITLAGSGTAGTQLLRNPSFETDANHDNQPDKFSYTNFSLATDKRDCTVHKSGACSLKLVGNARQKTAAQTILKSGVAGDDFTFSLWSKASSIPTGSLYRVQVQFFNGTTPVGVPQIANFATGTHGFVKVGGTFTASGPYTKLVFKIIFKASRGSAWFDAGALNWAP